MRSADTKLCGVLRGDALKTVLSPYLENGFQQDQHHLHEVTIDGTVATATCSLPTYFISPSEGRFHLSGLGGSAFVWQVGIVHAHFLAGQKRKCTEVLLREYSLKCSKAISNPELINVELTLQRRRSLSAANSIFGWTFSLEHGLWRGHVTAIFSF